MPLPLTGVLLALESFVVLFVALHNWIPLGSLNDVAAVRKILPTRKLFFTTLSNFIPAAFGLAASLYFFKRGFPAWLYWYLWIFYVLACFGSAKSWWIPYFFGGTREHTERDRTMYAATHSFLPERNGIRPNTLHVLFDGVTLAILATLALLTWRW